MSKWSDNEELKEVVDEIFAVTGAHIYDLDGCTIMPYDGEKAEKIANLISEYADGVAIEHAKYNE